MKAAILIAILAGSGCATKTFTPICDQTLYRFPSSLISNEVISELLTDQYIKTTMDNRRERYHQLRDSLTNLFDAEIDLDAMPTEDIEILGIKLRSDFEEFAGYWTVPGTTKLNELRYLMANEIFNIAAKEIISETKIDAKRAWNHYCPVDSALNQLIIDRAISNSKVKLEQYSDT